MGKSGKKSKASQRKRCDPYLDGGDVLPSSAYDLPANQEEVRDRADGEGEGKDGGGDVGVVENGTPLCALYKFNLYQQSVQSPKGDISYLQKFFLMYVGGRWPLHLQEDFCGTALLRFWCIFWHIFVVKSMSIFDSSEWLHSDPRRTAVGLDLDFEALNWCLDNNISNIGYDGYSRISLFHGNVLHPHKAQMVMREDGKDCVSIPQSIPEVDPSVHAYSTLEAASLPPRDIVCAFNYSCCCLQQREDLVRYFKHALGALSNKGGIFVMDLYGGSSSERKLRLQRKFSSFTYIWEQDEFDIISRRTRISLHFHLGKNRTFGNAFSYDWRLWSLPEINDCLREAGFQSTHFWIREMPNTEENEDDDAYDDSKYKESSTFMQQDAWNAYVVGVANFNPKP